MINRRQDTFRISIYRNFLLYFLGLFDVFPLALVAVVFDVLLLDALSPRVCLRRSWLVDSLTCSAGSVKSSRLEGIELDDVGSSRLEGVEPDAAEVAISWEGRPLLLELGAPGLKWVTMARHGKGVYGFDQPQATRSRRCAPVFSPPLRESERCSSTILRRLLS